MVKASEVEVAALQAWQADVVEDASRGEPVHRLTSSEVRWLRAVGRENRRFVMLWMEVLWFYQDAKAAEPLLAKLREIMRQDVTDTVATLRGAPQLVRAAWVSWYGTWVRDVVDAVARDCPELFEAGDAVAAKRVEAEERLSGRSHSLYDLLARRNGWLYWDPATIAPQIGARSSRRSSAGAKLKHAADVLVSAGLARWKARQDGRPWALEMTDKRPPG